LVPLDSSDIATPHIGMKVPLLYVPASQVSKNEVLIILVFIFIFEITSLNLFVNVKIFNFLYVVPLILAFADSLQNQTFITSGHNNRTLVT
jgi:hypothetical protein